MRWLIKRKASDLKKKIIKTVYDSPQSSTKGLALQVEKVLGFRLKNTNILQELLGKKTPAVSTICRKAITITENVSLPPEKRKLFSDNNENNAVLS